jgi:hypothetical protein
VQDQEYAEDQLNTLMKRYKDNEDARDKFVSEQRQELSRGAKKGPVISGSDGNPVSGESSEGWGAMFGSAPDLAIQRKQGTSEARSEARSEATSEATSSSEATATAVDISGNIN